MKTLVIVMVLLVGAPISSNANSLQQKLWQYPCDVLMAGACLRLPAGMLATYEVPADFGLHEIQKDGDSLLSVYVGSAPNRSGIAGAPSLSLHSRVHHLTGFVSNEAGIKKLDIFISPTQRRLNDTVIHVRARVTAENKDLISLVLSSLRPCVNQARGELVCPKESAWGQEISAWVLNGQPSETGEPMDGPQGKRPPKGSGDS